VSRAALTLGLVVAWYLTNRSRDAQSDPDVLGDTSDDYDITTPEGALWLALSTARDDGADIAN
jgi:hypothetical protein